MDSDSFKIVISFLSGLLSFSGGLLTFINGRLNEATTPEGKERVYKNAYSIFVFALSPIPGFVIFFIVSPITVCYIMLSYLTLQIILFLLKNDTINRSQVILMCFWFSFTSSIVILEIMFFFIKELVASETRLTTIIEHLTNVK